MINNIYRGAADVLLTGKEPLQPSSDSSATELSDDLSFSYKRKEKPKPVKVEDVVARAIAKGK